MMASDFQRKLRKLNSNLRIFCGDNANQPAGISLRSDMDDEPICGIDKNFIPQWPIYDERGRILKGGWYRAIKILIAERLVDRRKAQKVFGTEFNVRLQQAPKWMSKIDKAIADMESRMIGTKARTDDVVDIGRMIAQDK